MRLYVDSFIYLFFGVLNSLVPFILIPFMASSMMPAEYGILAIFEVFVLFATVILPIGVDNAISVYYHRLGPEEFRSYLTSAIMVPLVMMFVVSIILAVFYLPLNSAYSLTFVAFLAVPFIAFSRLILQLLLILLQFAQKSFQYGLIQLVCSFFNIFLSILFVVIYKMGWEGRVYALCITSWVIIVVVFAALYKMNYLSKMIKYSYIKDALLIGYPIVPHAVSNIIMYMSGRLILKNLVGMSAVGVFSVGYQIGMILYVIQTAYNTAWVPYLYSNLSAITESKKRQIVIQSFAYAGILLFSVVAIYFLTPLIFKLFFSERYYAAQDVVIWVSIGYLFTGLYKIPVNLIFYEKRTSILGWLALLNVAVSLVLNYFLIRLFGMMGAAYATAVTFFVMFFLVAIVAQKIYPMPWFFYLYILRDKLVSVYARIT